MKLFDFGILTLVVAVAVAYFTGMAMNEVGVPVEHTPELGVLFQSK